MAYSKSELVELLRQYAQRYGINEAIAIAQIQQESEFNPRAGSSAGAQGIAQFIPATARRFGVNVWDVNSSFDGWGRYMRLMLDMFGEDRYDLALAGYNSGENRAEYRNAAAQGRTINWSVLPRGVQSETQHYVSKILSNAGSPVVNYENDNNYDGVVEVLRINSSPAYGSYEEYLAATESAADEKPLAAGNTVLWIALAVVGILVVDTLVNE